VNETNYNSRPTRNASRWKNTAGLDTFVESSSVKSEMYSDNEIREHHSTNTFSSNSFM